MAEKRMIRKDRRHASLLPEKRLVTKCSDGTYEIIKSVPDSGNHLATKWQPDGNQRSTTWQPFGNQVATKRQKTFRGRS